VLVEEGDDVQQAIGAKLEALGTVQLLLVAEGAQKLAA